MDASFHFLCGQGDVQINGQKHSIKKGLVLEVPKKCYHGFTTQSQVTFLSIQTSPIYNEDEDHLDLTMHKSIKQGSLQSLFADRQQLEQYILDNLTSFAGLVKQSPCVLQGKALAH